MGAKYDVLKVVTITGTICSICNAVVERVLFEDLLLALLISIVLVQLANEVNSKNLQNHTQEESESTPKEALKQLTA